MGSNELPCCSVGQQLWHWAPDVCGRVCVCVCVWRMRKRRRTRRRGQLWDSNSSSSYPSWGPINLYSTFTHSLPVTLKHTHTCIFFCCHTQKHTCAHTAHSLRRFKSWLIGWLSLTSCWKLMSPPSVAPHGGVHWGLIGLNARKFFQLILLPHYGFSAAVTDLVADFMDFKDQPWQDFTAGILVRRMVWDG